MRDKMLTYFFTILFALSLLFIPDIKQVNASEMVLPVEYAVGYGAHISGYEITSTKQALELYGQKKVYTIKPSSKPLKKSGFAKYSTYNKHSKNYYTIRSYMEEFEKKGGGTLILKAGTYKISNTIFVPKNVTIIFEDGVNIIKTNKTGTKKLKTTTSLFQLVTPKKANKKKAVKKYNGVKNVNFIGIGNVTIDLKNLNKNIAIICGHNKNIRISGISFQNMNNGHFLEIDACSGVVVDHCTFTGVKSKSDYTKEAINLDTPDKTTKGFSCKWSAMDQTPNKNVSITNCYFSKMGRAIGTHKYSAKKKKQILHTGIVISNNVITDMYNDGPIRVINWKNSEISNNTIVGVVHMKQPSKKDTRGILLSGTNNVTVTKNFVAQVGRAFQYMAWKNSGAGSKYPVTKDVLTAENKLALADNVATELYKGEAYTRITYKYKVYSNAEKIPLKMFSPVPEDTVIVESEESVEIQ